MLFITLGGVAALIPNPLFIRMTPVGVLEWVSLAVTSALLGSYLGLRHYTRHKGFGHCNIRAGAGGVLGFLAFGCSICNKLLVLAFGVSGVLTYFEPLRPLFGVVSVPVLLYAHFGLIRRLRRPSSSGST